jgi:segregation and condensation protein A
METTDVKFRLDIFEGPLDLLLHLIKTNELEISEISIATITSQYLDYLRMIETMDLEVAGDYLVMAATLINIKLRAILPAADEELEEESEELDEFMSAKLLMQRLIEYRRFKEAARHLGGSAERQAQIFLREVALPKIEQAEADPEFQADLETLLGAFARVIRFVDRREFHQIRSEEFNTEEKVVMLRRRLLLEERIHLMRLFEQCRAKVEMIVTVLAILELCRLKELRVVQAGVFDEVLLVPCREGDAASRSELADQARRAKAAEADILANRTGIVDDGILPAEDDEDLESDDADDTDAGSANVIDIASVGEPSDTSADS